jgi:Na+/H+ antiporter NhaC
LLLPAFVGLAFALGERDPELGGRTLALLSTAAVLDGALCGRHASPLATSTIAASVASSCDHADHVRTQLPYALLAAACALCVGYFPCAMLGWNPWAALGAGLAAQVMLLAVFGRRSLAPAS